MHPLALLLLILRVAGASFKICAFNMHGFGEAKAGDARVMGALVKILARCDIAAVQEVRDAKGEAVLALLRELNRYDPSHSYAQLGSRRLGRGTYKEQIVFVYRADLVLVTDWYQFGEAGDFARGPFAARFHAPSTAIKDFVLLSHHASPRDAPREIDRLYRLCQELTQRWGTQGNGTLASSFPLLSPQNVMILGDLNAGGTYVPPSAWGSIRLRCEPGFHWLIGDSANTTVRARTHCAYDRIVVQGDQLLRAVVPGSAKPYNFAQNLGLSEEEALQVSDHYPVEVNLRLAGWVPGEL
ncbi:deoxyribonuclease-1-like [Emydura macquarii macquarii]|uniref:deoxyribonuclease-1-like n=1 Tax=Emydura macquarii macquarii TaxID=1129001 RepID=UPI00352AD155